MAKFKKRYGLDWDATLSDVFIDLTCAKKWRFEPYCDASLNHPADHMLRAMRALFTHDELSISKWTEQHVLDFTTEKFCITLGSASCSKSNDYGVLVLLDWLTDPTETLTIIASTTVEMLKIRSYESVMRYFQILKRNPYFAIPGKESKTTTAILNVEDDENIVTTKASIRGVAVAAGSVEDARARLAGCHLPWVRVVGDELSNMRPAFMEARTNLSIGTKDFRLFGLANPMSITDLACRYCEPEAPGGWASVTRETEEWRSRYGKVRHHNGMRSPAVLEPDGTKKYPYLINKEQIDNIFKEHHGDDAPIVWSQVYGFPVPKGSDNAVISEREIVAFKAQEPAIWVNESDMVRLGALDPAFTADGDGCVLASASIGRASTGQAILSFDPPFYFPIAASSEKPVAYQIVDTLRTELSVRGIQLRNFAIDSSGTSSIADVIEREIGSGLYRVNYACAATEGRISSLAQDSAKDRYRNVISEAWALLAEFVRFGQIRNLPLEVVEQVTKRMYRNVVASKLKALETKTEYKKRTGLGSPDAADAAAMLCLVARDRLGFVPGGAPGCVDAASSFVGGQMITGYKPLKATYLLAYKGKSGYAAR